MRLGDFEERHFKFCQRHYAGRVRARISRLYSIYGFALQQLLRVAPPLPRCAASSPSPRGAVLHLGDGCVLCWGATTAPPAAQYKQDTVVKKEPPFHPLPDSREILSARWPQLSQDIADNECLELKTLSKCACSLGACRLRAVPSLMTADDEVQRPSRVVNGSLFEKLNVSFYFAG
jgi:hypothetical protein